MEGYKEIRGRHSRDVKWWVTREEGRARQACGRSDRDMKEG